MRLTRNARSSIPGTAWHSCQQPGPREEREGPPPPCSTGKATENQVAILGPAPDQGEEQNLGSGCRGGGLPLPQYTCTQHHHNQRRPWLGQLAAQEIMASAPAWGSGHSTAGWVSSQARIRSFSAAPCAVGFRSTAIVPGPESPETSPSPPGQAGRAAQVTCTGHTCVPAGQTPRVWRLLGAQAGLGDVMHTPPATGSSGED